jgi:hypothetical protein
MMGEGITLCRSIACRAELEEWRGRAEATYQALTEVRCHEGLAQATRLVPKGEKFVPTASSLTIRAVLPEEGLRAMLAGIAHSKIGDWIKEQLAGPGICDVDQSWVRRQYAPGRYPPLHAPHGWHQDGALGFRFLSQNEGASESATILSMATCWIALDACGTDAPGLEFIIRRLDELIKPGALTDESVRREFPEEALWRPVLAPGDAVVFRGDLLHRTYVTPAMTRDRTSIELRFFAADRIPERLKRDRFIPMD